MKKPLWCDMHMQERRKVGMHVVTLTDVHDGIHACTDVLYKRQAHECTTYTHTLLFGRGYWGVGNTIDQWLPSDSTRPLLRYWSTQLLLSSPGVPVLLLWVPVQELRVLLLCDSGSCVSCHGLLLPLSAFLSTASNSFLLEFRFASRVASYSLYCTVFTHQDWWILLDSVK